MQTRKTQSPSPPEFPDLDKNSLYACSTKGDGNCMFNALSDQLYGHQGEHQALRTRTIEHMREHAKFYAQYMVMDPVRRNPRRTTRAASRPSAPVQLSLYSEEEQMKEYESHLQRMGKSGEWADHMELAAFASALDVDIHLWQPEGHYTVHPRTGINSMPSKGDHPQDRAVLHIAYHKYEHYSSVRNLQGPHFGLPCVKYQSEAVVSRKRPSVQREADDLSSSPRAPKKRSPVHRRDSDTTPECSERSSNESLPQSPAFQTVVANRPKNSPIRLPALSKTSSDASLRSLPATQSDVTVVGPKIKSLKLKLPPVPPSDTQEDTVTTSSSSSENSSSS
ncbi:cysteine proteinase [Sporormia fimetaria CBS 119925]|uniref:Cysteine proteinase n=1 Tax=Sporormia fimetaria CBS 119925 TaxID=1340428 RepID=A0A6A6VIS0_9PLEO|nr:cysteine proteinase [Sporormia fimetaria CBS 119925]